MDAGELLASLSEEQIEALDMALAEIAARYAMKGSLYVINKALALVDESDKCQNCKIVALLVDDGVRFMAIDATDSRPPARVVKKMQGLGLALLRRLAGREQEKSTQSHVDQPAWCPDGQKEDGK